MSIFKGKEKRREAELRELILGNDEIKFVEGAISLCNEFFIPSRNFEEAEAVLLENLGRQTKLSNLKIELALGKLYVAMEENSRAIRFLNAAASSLDESIKAEAEKTLQEMGEIQ